MKLLSLALCIFLIAPLGYTKDTPMPWPLSSNVLPVETVELIGAWVAYEHNTIWFIRISSTPEASDLIHIDIRSNGIRTHHAQGWLAQGQKIYVGNVLGDDKNTYGGSIYRDREGFKLRIIRNQNSYYDLHLYRAK